MALVKLTKDKLSYILGSIKTKLAAKQDKLSLPQNASQYLNGTGEWSTPPNTTYEPVTDSANGLMTPALKQAVDNIEANISIRLGVCASAADASAKAITISDGMEWSIGIGKAVAVLFENGNTASSMTVSINGSAAQPVGVLETPLIPAGAMVLFYFV